MKQRIITALWGLPVLLACIWIETPWFPLLLLLIAAVAVLGALEFYRLASLAGGQPLTYFGLVWVLGFIANAHFEDVYTVPLLASAMALPLIWLLVRSARRTNAGVALADWGWTLMGILYVGWALSRFVVLRELDQGWEWVLVALACTIACDTTAYFVGRKWGRRPLAPTISPKKTWEGAIAGFLASVCAAQLLNFILIAVHLALPLGFGGAALLGCLLGVLVQVGDLFESRLKRRAGVKDSGSWIPGHGGILDRFDSAIFAGVVVYYYVICVAS